MFLYKNILFKLGNVNNLTKDESLTGKFIYEKLNNLKTKAY